MADIRCFLPENGGFLPFAGIFFKKFFLLDLRGPMKAESEHDS
jgi:hypothetical protein